MGLSSAVRWWEEWQLRILVLGSLFVQFFLCFSAFVRTLTTLRRLRALVWIAYIGGDALAIYALATLFNRHCQQQTTMDGGTSGLEVIWAPILLIHLGGQPGISAYSLEDNDLWKRHAVTVVSQVTVALYVFCKRWSGEKRLLQAAVLLFVVGIIKSSHKPWALKRASFNSMLASTVVSPRREERSILWCWTWCTSYLGDIVSAKKKKEREEEEEQKIEGGGGGTEKGALLLEEYVEQAALEYEIECKQDVVVASDQATDYQKEVFRHTDYMYKMLVDLPVPYSRRLSVLRSFLKFDEKQAYDMLQRCLRNIFGLLYTRNRSTSSLLGYCLLYLLPFFSLASLVLFIKSHKDGYNEDDVKVTYILFYCTTVQEFLPYLFTGLQNFRFYDFKWHDMVSQYSIMSFYDRKRKSTVMLKLGPFNFLREYISFLREYISKHWCISDVHAAFEITGLVHRHVKDGWKEICDVASYRRFNSLRGQQTLRHHQLGRLGWSLKVPFDESVLLWHIATDLCFHHPTSPQGCQGDDTQRNSREISNYMIYLLFICPEILMPGTRPGLFTDASDDIEVIMKNTRAPLDERSIAQWILRMTQDPDGPIPNACRLGEALMGLGNEERWKVIQGVWVEMICYSASRCRGYLHAKSLGEGGEYLSYVWLLWSFMGMETLADRHQMPEPPIDFRSQGEADQSAEVNPV